MTIEHQEAPESDHRAQLDFPGMTPPVRTKGAKPVKLVWSAERELLFPLGEVEAYAKLWRSIETSATWGELRSMIDADDVTWLIEAAGEEDEDGEPIRTGRDDSLEPLRDALEASVEYHTWPFPPEDLGYEMLLDALPPAACRALEALEDEAWEVGASMTTGDLIEIWDMDAVVAALEGAGVRCARADLLVEAAYGPND